MLYLKKKIWLASCLKKINKPQNTLKKLLWLEKKGDASSKYQMVGALLETPRHIQSRIHIYVTYLGDIERKTEALIEEKEKNWQSRKRDLVDRPKLTHMKEREAGYQACCIDFHFGKGVHITF